MASLAFGYLRVSTQVQNHDLQRDAVIAAGVAPENVFVDTTSGSSSIAHRPGMAALLAKVREGDEIVVWRIDRLGRSMVDIATTVESLLERGVRLRSLTDGVDPATTSGRLMLGIIAAMAQYERDLIRERVNAGIAAARERGTTFGRPPLDPGAEREQGEMVAALMLAGKSVPDVVRLTGMSRSTVYRRLEALRSGEHAVVG